MQRVRVDNPQRLDMRHSSQIAYAKLSFRVVLARISSTHFGAPLLRDVAAELIEQSKERGNLRADCPLSIVDLDAHSEDPGIVFLSADTQRDLQYTRDFFDRP